MVSYLGTFVQSRRLHSVLAFFVILVAVFFSFGGRGFAIEHSRGGAHARELSYATTAETLASGYIVSDLKIQRCIRGVACKAPRDGKYSYWEKVPIKLNPFPRHFQPFNYFVYVEKSKIHESERYVIDVSFTITDLRPTPMVEGAGIDLQKISSSGYMWIQYISTVMPQVPMVRDVNVILLPESMTDPRKYWTVSPENIPIPGDQEAYVRISLLKANLPQEVQILQTEKDFEEVLKKNEILLSSDPKFKIMQIGDISFRVRNCRSCDAAQLETHNFIKTALKEEADVRLIVITGFTLTSSTEPHPESMVLQALWPILDSGIPFIYASSIGISHWENQSVRRNFDNFLASLPGCYNRKFENLDHRIKGVSNGNLKIYSAPADSAGIYTDYNAILSKGADAFVSYLDTTSGIVDPSQSNFLYRINEGEKSKTELKLLFLDHPYVRDYTYLWFRRFLVMTESDFKKYLDDFRVTGYKAIAFNSPAYEHKDGQSCEWQDTEDSKVFKCTPGSVGLFTRPQSPLKREVRLFQFSFEENKIVTWRRDRGGSADTQLVWAGQPKPNPAAEEVDSEKNAPQNDVAEGDAAKE